MFSVNRYTRNKIVIPNRVIFAGGYPKWHWIPKFVNWKNISVYWLDTELVILRKKKEDQ